VASPEQINGGSSETSLEQSLRRTHLQGLQFMHGHKQFIESSCLYKGNISGPPLVSKEIAEKSDSICGQSTEDETPGAQISAAQPHTIARKLWKMKSSH
jgi:hypothetical protein